MNYYSTGQFAKLANVTIRTIRYYDKVGLLKPSFIMENGYRRYSESDLISLQKIIALKQIGFSLEEIYPLVLNDDKETYKESLSMQLQLVDKKMQHLKLLKEAIKSSQVLLDKDQLEWNKVAELIRLTNKDDTLFAEYKNANNLNIRIDLHTKFSTNKEKWFDWLYNKIEFKNVNRLLELGCGNGELWINKNINLRNREIYLSDKSEGMLKDAKKRLGNDYSYFVIDAESIPFRKEYFNSIIMNHSLFHVNDIETGIKEIARVLKDDGIFYCSAYGENHMKEITSLVKEFDQSIVLSNDYLYIRFGLSNGHDLLSLSFKNITMEIFEDELEINDAQMLFDYIVSCYGNQNEIIGQRLAELKLFLDNKLKQEKVIRVTKEVGLFIAKK